MSSTLGSPPFCCTIDITALRRLPLCATLPPPSPCRISPRGFDVCSDGLVPAADPRTLPKIPSSSPIIPPKRFSCYLPTIARDSQRSRLGCCPRHRERRQRQ